MGWPHDADGLAWEALVALDGQEHRRVLCPPKTSRVSRGNHRAGAAIRARGHSLLRCAECAWTAALMGHGSRCLGMAEVQRVEGRRTLASTWFIAEYSLYRLFCAWVSPSAPIWQDGGGAF